MTAMETRWFLLWAVVLVSTPAARGRELEKLPYDFSDGLMAIPVTVANENCWVAVDTGASHSVLDISFRKKLGPVSATTQMRTVNGQIDVDLHSAPEFSIGRLRVRGGQEIGCISLASVQPAGGTRISGIIGMDILQQFIVQIDPDQTTIKFLDDLTTPTETWGEQLELTLGEFNIPRVVARVNRVTLVTFKVDFGCASSGSISTTDCNKLVVADRDLLTPIGYRWVGGLAKVVQRVSFRVDSIALGDFEHSQIVFSAETDSHLGLHYFRRFKTTFDFPRRKLYLKPSKYFHDYDHSDVDGRVIFPELVDGRGFLVGVYGKSPAATVGVRNRDLLVDVDGQAVGEMGPVRLTRYLEWTTDHDVSIGVERLGQKLRFTLPRGRRIGRINSEK